MKIKIITIIITIFLFFSVTAAAASYSKIWKQRLKEPWINHMLFISDKELNENNTYEKLRTFFNECTIPKEFYDRIQKYVGDYFKDGESDLPPNETSLSRIANEITDNNATLFCHQQAYLFIAGVIAMFSHYDEHLKRYVLNDECGDFKMELWRSFDVSAPPIYLYRSHIQVVINKWNGSEIFYINGKYSNRLEVDTWENEFRPFNKRNDCLFFPFFPAKLNSVIITGKRLIPLSR